MERKIIQRLTPLTAEKQSEVFNLVSRDFFDAGAEIRRRLEEHEILKISDLKNIGIFPGINEKYLIALGKKNPEFLIEALNIARYTNTQIKLLELSSTKDSNETLQNLKITRILSESFDRIDNGIGEKATKKEEVILSVANSVSYKIKNLCDLFLNLDKETLAERRLGVEANKVQESMEKGGEFFVDFFPRTSESSPFYKAVKARENPEEIDYNSKFARVFILNTFVDTLIEETKKGKTYTQFLADFLEKMGEWDKGFRHRDFVHTLLEFSSLPEILNKISFILNKNLFAEIDQVENFRKTNYLNGAKVIKGNFAKKIEIQESLAA